MGRRSGGEHRYGAGAGTRARATLGTSVQPSWVRSASTTIQGWGIRNPKVETRNKFKFPISQCSKPAAAAWFWSFPCWCLGFVSGFGFRFSDLSPQRSVVLSRFARVERRASALSRVYSVGAWGKEPQRREERREKWEGEAATANHLSVIDSQVTEIGLSLRPSRLCGLTGLSSTAWSRLRPAGLPKTRFAPQRQAGPRQSRKAKMLRPAGSGPVTLPAKAAKNLALSRPGAGSWPR